MMANAQDILTAMTEALTREGISPRSGVALADTTFADMGLDSVRAVELTGQIGDRFGLDVDPMLVFDFPTPRALAQAILDEAG